MKLETIKRNNKKKIIIGSMIVLSAIGCLTLTTTHARYRNVQSIKIANGTVKLNQYDFKIMALKQSEDGINYTDIDTIPESGYVINEEKSYCTTDNKIQVKGKLKTVNGIHGMNGLTKNDKCYIWFDKITDTEKPIITNIATSVTKTEINVIVTATDNVGVTEYWYQLDNQVFVNGTSNTYTFSGLEKGSIHKITVYVKDAIGNISETVTKEEVITEKDEITLAFVGYDPNAGSINYEYNGISETFEAGDDITLPIGAIISYPGRCGYLVEIYSSLDGNSSSKIAEVRGTNTYTLTGQEKSYGIYTCFTGDVELWAYDEKKKKKLKRKVKTFKVGNKLYTYDLEKDKYVVSTIEKIETSKVNNIYAIYLENGEIIRCSSGHQFYVENAGYMKAKELKENMSLIGADGNIKITKIEKENYKEGITLYKILLSNNRNCFVTSAKVLSYLSTLSLVNIVSKEEALAISCEPC